MWAEGRNYVKEGGIFLDNRFSFCYTGSINRL